MGQETDCLFVYGTLMGGTGHPVAARLARESRAIGPASAGGLLYDFGTYPGAIPSALPGNRVHGLVVKLARPSEAFAWLDEYERADVPDPAKRLFRRAVVHARLSTGDDIDAWMYYCLLAPTWARLLPGGRYRARKPLAVQRT